jgi:hypothetical protein
MNRSFFAVPAMICLVAVSITAQAPAEQPTTQKPAAQQPARPAETPATAANKLTYTGCLKPGTATGTWILENAEVAAKPGASAPGSVGTSGAAKMTLNLDPAATVNLTPHANHKVEVSGMVSAARPSAEAAPSSAAGAQAPRQQFSVESMKMVSATCP